MLHLNDFFAPSSPVLLKFPNADFPLLVERIELELCPADLKVFSASLKTIIIIIII